ncbi:MAG TPA: ABC transporter substrate-binding protein [Polyangia bacterium]|nr:ABC transporter substrate-binding protein [Polyangia bacterium]
MDAGGRRRWSRRAWLAAGLAGPVAAAALVGPRVRGALLGTAALTDGRIVLPPDGGFPRTLRGPVGDRWTLAAPPRRVVSTYLAADEILASLLPPGRMAAVSVFADDPIVSNVAGLYPGGVARVRAQVEAILSLAPDLVCVAGYSDADGLRLEIGAGLPVLRWSRFETFEDVFANVRILGAAVGADAAAEALAAGAERELAALHARLAGVTPVRALYLDPPDFSAGAGTLIDEMLSRAGAVNVVRQARLDGAGPIPVETALALDPDVLVMPAAPGAAPPLTVLRAAPLWRELRAARNAAVVNVPSAWAGDVSHYAARAPAAIARALHPSRFG